MVNKQLVALRCDDVQVVVDRAGRFDPMTRPLSVLDSIECFRSEVKEHFTASFACWQIDYSQDLRTN